MAIFVYNKQLEDYSFMDNCYYIGRSKTGNVLGNPYSYPPEKKTLAIYKCKSLEECLNKYSDYFDLMYGANKEFTKVIDEIYDKYKRGEDVYLECWCKKSKIGDAARGEEGITCHGDIIKAKLEKRLLKEKIKAIKQNPDAKH